MDPALRLGRRDSLHAVRAALPFEDGERAVALHGEDRLLDATAVVLARREGLGAEAAPLGVALEHPGDLGRPERRLVAAHALSDLDDDVLRVGGIALDKCKLELVLEPCDVGLELRRHGGEVGVPLRLRQIGRRLTPLAGRPHCPLELLEAPSELRRLAVVRVDGGIRHPLLELGMRALELVCKLIEGRHTATHCIGALLSPRVASRATRRA